MKILIIGKTGQIGSAVAKKAQEKNHEVFSFSSNELDITNKVLVEEKITTIAPDVVINTAAFHVVPECEKDPDKAFAINASAVKYLADACKKINAIFVHYSTDKVFDGFANKAYQEVDIPSPIQIYGISKLTGEYIASSYNPKTFIIRMGGVYGGVTGSKAKNGNFVLYILREAKQKKTLEIASDQFSSFSYAEDVADVTLQLLTKKATFGIYNVVNRGYTSWANFAKKIVTFAKVDLQIIPIERKGLFKNVPTPGFSVLDPQKILSTGIQIPEWENALQRYIAFLNTQK